MTQIAKTARSRDERNPKVFRDLLIERAKRIRFLHFKRDIFCANFPSVRRVVSVFDSSNSDDRRMIAIVNYFRCVFYGYSASESFSRLNHAMGNETRTRSIVRSLINTEIELTYKTGSIVSFAHVPRRAFFVIPLLLNAHHLRYRAIIAARGRYGHRFSLIGRLLILIYLTVSAHLYIQLFRSLTNPSIPSSE